MRPNDRLGVNPNDQFGGHIHNMGMIRTYTTLTLLLLAAIFGMSRAATIDNDYFAITTPDDSWWVNNDAGALREVGARALLYRNDANHHILELARVDCLEGAFNPQEYLKQQIVERNDPFAHSATHFSAIADTTFVNHPAKRVHFDKQQGQSTYHCTAMSFNVGFSTYLVIQAHRHGNANVVGWVLSTGMKIKSNALPIALVSHYVEATQKVLKKHRLPIYKNEYLDNIKLSGDSTTVEMEIVIPYTHAKTINVPAFVQVMRQHWSETFERQVAINSLYRAIVTEQKAIKYTYIDNDGLDIGVLLITPPEYNLLLKQQQ